jgi:hypothetical protein
MKTINYNELTKNMIPAECVEIAQKRLEKLAKVAKKLGVELPTMTVGESFIVKQMVQFINGKRPVYREYVEVIVSGPQAKIAGYTFIAKVEHTSVGNLVSMAPNAYDMELPVEFRTAAPTCDHCQKTRSRKETFVLQRDSDGGLVRVGRQCLRDFLGHDNPENLVDMIFSLDGVLDYDMEEFWGAGGSPRRIYILEDFLTHVCASVRRVGYVTSKQAYEDYTKISTGHSADMQMFARDRGDKGYDGVSDVDITLAKKMVDWFQMLPESEFSNQYFHNLRVAVLGHTTSDGVGYIRIKDVNLVASLYMAYQKVNGESANKEREERKVSQHVGQVKDKITVTGTLVNTRICDGAYGATTLLTVVDACGNKFQWWQSGGFHYDVNTTITLTGTIKGHTEYAGVKITTLTRCKVG